MADRTVENESSNERSADQSSHKDSDDAATQHETEATEKFSIIISDFIDVLDPRWEYEGAGQTKPDADWYINKGHPFDKYTRITFCKGFWCTLKESVTAEEHLMFFLRNTKYEGKELFQLTEIEGQEEWNLGQYHMKQLYWPILQKIKEEYIWLKEDREKGPEVPGWWREDMLDKWVTSTSHTMRKRFSEGKTDTSNKRNIPGGVPKLSSKELKAKAKQVYPLSAMRFVVQDTSVQDGKEYKVQFPRVFKESTGPEGVDISSEQDSFGVLTTILTKDLQYNTIEEELGYNVVMALGRVEFFVLADHTSLQNYIYNHRKAGDQDMSIIRRKRVT